MCVCGITEPWRGPVLRLSGSDQEGCCGVVSFPKLRLCPGMPTSMVSLSQSFHAACCSPASLARLVIYGEEFGVLLAEHFFQKPRSICSEEVDQREGISGRGSGMNSNDTRGCRGIRRLRAQAPH